MRKYNRGKMIPFGASADNPDDSANRGGFDNTDPDAVGHGENPDNSGEGGNDQDLDGNIDDDMQHGGDRGGNDDWNDPNSPDHDQMSEALGGEQTDSNFDKSAQEAQDKNNQFDPSDISDIKPYSDTFDNDPMHGQDRQYGDEGSWNSDAPYNDFSGSGDSGGKGYTDFSV